MQIQRFESITQKYPQFPTALLANEALTQGRDFFCFIRYKIGHKHARKISTKVRSKFTDF